MQATITQQEINETVTSLRERIAIQPRVGLILGSGLNALGASVAGAQIIPFSEVPHWPASTVVGHSGRLVVGTLENQPVFVMQGRLHFYEGYNLSQVTLPVRVMNKLGIEILIVTNAAGGINPDFIAGDLMLITDHLNLAGMSGNNPLAGPNLDEFGPRFPDMSQAYDRSLAGVARNVARGAGLALREGVYAGLSGPSFETPAELRFLRAAGIDAVGMSTVSEVTVARHGNMRVLGFSGISNKASLDGSAATTHEEVMEAGRVIAPKMETMIRGVLSAL